MEDNDMQTNSTVQVNWGTFNIPTLVGMVAVFAMVWNLSATLTGLTSKLGAVDEENTKLNTEQAEQIRTINSDITVLPTVTLRLTIAETNINAINARIDRQTDAMSDLRGDIASVKSDIGVLSSKFDNTFPTKKTEADSVDRFMVPGALATK